MKTTHKKISKSYATTNQVAEILNVIAEKEHLNASVILDKLIFSIKEKDFRTFHRFYSLSSLSLKDNEKRIIKTFSLSKEAKALLEKLADSEHLNLSTLITKIVHAVNEGDTELFEIYSEKI